MKPGYQWIKSGASDRGHTIAIKARHGTYFPEISPECFTMYKKSNNRGKNRPRNSGSFASRGHEGGKARNAGRFSHGRNGSGSSPGIQGGRQRGHSDYHGSRSQGGDYQSRQANQGGYRNYRGRAATRSRDEYSPSHSRDFSRHSRGKADSGMFPKKWEECPECYGRSSQGKMVECPECRGTGKVPKVLRVTCKVCHGKLRIPCPKCHARGRINTGFEKGASAKAESNLAVQPGGIGTGMAGKQEVKGMPGDLCPACNGRKYLLKHCKACNDTGVFLKKADTFVACTKCKRMGTVWQEGVFCETCHGFGKVPS